MPYSLSNVFKGSTIYAAGQVLTKALAFGLIPLYTRFLTTADYGLVGFLQATLAVMTTIATLGFYGAQTRYYYDGKSEEELGSFIFSINLTLFVGGGAIFLVASGFGGRPYELLSVEAVPFSPYIHLIIWTAFVQIFNQLLVSYFMAAKQFKRCAALQVAQFVLMNGFIVLYVVGWKEGGLGQVRGVLHGNIVFFLLFFYAYARKFRLQFSFEHIRYALVFGVPIVLHLLGGVVNNSIGRMILVKYVTIDDLGRFSLGYNMGLVMQMVVNSVQMAWGPNFYELMNSEHLDHRHEVRRAFVIWLGGVSAICMIGMLWSREVVVLLVPPSYHGASSVIGIILLSCLIAGVAQFVQVPIFYYKKTRVLPLITGSSVVLNIALNLVLIPRLGIIGAAYATLGAFTARAIGVYVYSRVLFNPSYQLARVFIIVLCLAVVAVLPVFQRITAWVEVVKGLTLIGFALLFCSLFLKELRPMVERLRAVLRARKAGRNQ